MSISDRIKELIEQHGNDFRERGRSLDTECPKCGRSDKFSILKENGSCICYHGSCGFKGWFEDWLILKSGNRLSRKQAYTLIHGNKEKSFSLDVKIKLHGDEDSQAFLQPVEYPPRGCVNAKGTEGAAYLDTRGFNNFMIEKYQITYNDFTRRVYFPIFMDGLCYGYQGRAIDPVEKGERMRFNEGFRRERLVMFIDRLNGSDHAIIAEGPVDAIKFDLVGGNIATMGKIVTDYQIALIRAYGIKKVYLALDEDAEEQSLQLAGKLGCQVYKISIPESCKKRCAELNKKADFGECTLDECKEAFNNATLCRNDLVIKLEGL